jgi:hypothetical protein
MDESIVHKNESYTSIAFYSTRMSYMDLDFLLGAKTAFETSMTAIFNHKQLRAAEILEKQIKEQESSTSSNINTEKSSTDEIKIFEESLQTSDEKRVEEGSTISNDTSVDEATSSGTKSVLGSEQINSESSEALKRAIEDKKDVKAELKDLNNDVKFVPDLEGALSFKWSPFLTTYGLLSCLMTRIAYVKMVQERGFVMQCRYYLHLLSFFQSQ